MILIIYIYIFFTTFQYISKTFLIFLFPTPQNFPSLEIHFFIFQVLKVFQGAWEPCYRFPQVKNQKLREYPQLHPKKCVIGIEYVNLYVIGIMFNLHKNDACSMFWLRPIFRRYGNQENDQWLMFLKKGGKGLGTFLWTKLTNESTLI